MQKATNITYFILRGLSQRQEVQILFFVLFLSCYVVILMGNFVIIITIRCSHLINQPMYFFLSHLSLMDLFYTSTVAPKLITDLLYQNKIIYFNNCMIQLLTMHLFGSVEAFILTGMAYDRCVAICKPLHYMIIMNPEKCIIMIGIYWIMASLHAVIQLLLTIQLPFCGPNEIDHYFCDVYPLLKLACTDTFLVGVLDALGSGTIVLVFFVILMGSYVVILVSLQNRSSEGRRKALSTCTSHIMVVTLFFGPCLFIYIRPAKTYPEDKVFAVFYTFVAPMFNPLIYTLRNLEMKNAMRKVWSFFLSEQRKI